MPAAVALSHRDIMRILVGVLLGMFLSALDQTIVATALPRMAGELGGLEHLSWIVAGYLLTSTATTPIYGKLSDLYGRRVMLLAAITIFMTASVLCALARNMPEIIIARALQGIGGGGLLTMAQAIVADIIAPRERGRYQAYFSGIYAVASISGPVVGGLFVDHLSWRWVFWINIPLGLGALALCRTALKHLPVNHLKRRIDYLGAALLVAAVSALLLLVSWAGTQYAWTAPEPLALLAAALILVASFAVWERRTAEPIVPPRVFANPIVRQALLASMVITFMQMGLSMMVPSFLQLVAGVSAGTSGLLLIPMTVGGVAGSFTAGRVMRRTGRYKPAAIAGLSLTAGALVALAFAADAHSLPLVVAAMALVALGTSPSFPAMMVAGQNGAELRDIGVVTSMITFSRSLGGAFGTAVLWSVLIGALFAGLGPSALPLAQTLMRGGPTAAARLPEASRALLHPDLVGAYRTVFLICAGIAVGAIVVLAFLREKPLRSEPAFAARDSR
jgi:EmrB/QacA subfamily drug resistance transporter